MASKQGEKESLSHKVGDKIEKVGQKISEKAPKTGKAIHDLGDKIEHMNDNKKSRRT
ncbi:hypothetical protein AB1A81_07995 [Bdellovibrio bacteriovorus]|uniref:Uncharacterized protein n=1 Tax=Bdellovibrio bacteriovorus (strain ATCC 15356 / DSM 50701 / NCIMB 9529 / HD100) TaxID=264462 RepID=Q6MM87_BDEBA|nr:hypothetical protein [Bdellovibrio bacteriovorus]BEV68158.1 hypothetical protein Bb109J_c1578 [Bdellovibrio bacteriovorus]CAE79618.1 hypothetical protein predicted by Glimmer/Critica [Bdellovibrio bacteriovorus HD100]